MMEDMLPLACNSSMSRNTESFAITEVKTVKHTHTWIVKGFSQCDCRYLETVPNISDVDVNKHLFRVRLHPQGNKDSNKDFCFFQVFSQSNLKYKAKFTVSNRAGEEIPATVYSGQQQLNGYFEYIRREQLLNHIVPHDEIKLVLNLIIVQDTMTRSLSTDPSNLPPKDTSLDTLSKNFGDHLMDNKFTDFTIRCRGDCPPIRCHRFILWSRSPVFKATLADHTDEYIRSEVVYDDIEYQDMKHFIHYIYTGKAPHLKTLNVAIEMLKLADRFDVADLKDLAEQSVRNCLSVENVCEILQVAEMHQTLNLKKECMRYLINNAPEHIPNPSRRPAGSHSPPATPTL
uniref:BTB domain-containing protein n=1 Tax=Panagrellus redivivus TaxID=6233 RepID=A0A7E4W4U6_PANRE